MSGLPLALGAVSGMVLAALVRDSRGPGSRNGAGRFVRLSPTPSGFASRPASFVRGTVLEEAIEGAAEGEAGLFHVTTNLPAVLADGRVLSRRDLRAAGRASAGLGGGLRDEAPGCVSVGIRLDGALRVLRAVRTMARAVHGTIRASEALHAMMDASASAVDRLDAASDWMLDGEDDDEAFVAATCYRDRIADAERAVLDAASGPDLYTALTRWEGVLADTLAAWTDRGWISDDESLCGLTVGFTESAARFARVRPEAVGLVRLAARRGSARDFVPQECEIRFRSEDLALIGVWEGE